MACDKKLIRQKFEEEYIYRKRINGKLVTLHHYGLISKLTGSKHHYCCYNGIATGETTKTKILEWLRRHTT